MSNQNRQQYVPVGIDAWHRLIAKKSKTSVEAVKRILDKHGIEPQSTTPIRKTIRFHKLQFSGIKKGTTNDGAFSFIWDNLDTGLYGVLSEDNLVGKSSVLRLMYSILRGDFSNVSEPVLEWINNLAARLCIGSTKLDLVLVREEDGLHATLTRSKDRAEIIEYTGHISDLSGTVEQLFMKELNFEKMFATKESKSLVSHGWPAIVSALFISGINGAIVGDLTFSGLPQRLLQCFIGLPWISTQSRASAVRKIVTESQKPENKIKNGINGLAEAIKRKQTELGRLPSPKNFEKQQEKWQLQYDLIDNEIKDYALQRTRKKIEIESISSDIVVMNKERIRSMQVLQALKDDMKAGFIFRKLQPVCCPSCESTNFKEGSTKDALGICPLCKEQESRVETTNDIRIIEQGEETNALKEQLAHLRESLDDQQRRLKSIKETLSVREKELEKLQQQKPNSRLDEEISIQRKSLEATIEELKSLERIYDPIEKTPTDELAILKATASETKKMYQKKEQQLFEDASTLLQITASHLGVKHLVNVTWTSTRLKIKVADTETSYTKLSPGEKLRFRIAAAISIAKLAAQTGEGRHPGVLFFDSPKAEEITEADFQEILSAITKIANKDDALQIFIASRISPNFDYLDVFKDSKVAIGKDFLF